MDFAGALPATLSARFGFDRSATTPRKSDAKYCRIAAKYVELKTAGSKHPVLGTADATVYTYSDVKKALSRARDRGFLDGDQLTDRGRRRLGLLT